MDPTPARPDAPPVPALAPIEDVAAWAVREAAERAKEAFRRLPEGSVGEKGPGDIVTELDGAIESMLVDRLLTAFPEHGFVGEEGAGVRTDAEWIWLVDPIDGTSNFSQGLYPYAVAAALLHRGAPVVAAVHTLPDDATWTAVLRGGARCQGRTLRCPAAGLSPRSILGVQWFRDQSDVSLVAAMQGTGARIRTYGCSVVQLCEVAAGRLHANIQEQGRPWDLAAAGLIAAEAGVRFTDWDGKPVERYPDPVHGHLATVAAPEPLHSQLMTALRSAGKA